MNKLQKIALLNLFLAMIILLFQLFGFLVSNLPIKLTASVITFVLCCIVVVLYLHRSQIARQGTSQYDERDKSIHKTAALAGYITAFLVLFSTILIVFLTVGPSGSVDIGHLFSIFILGCLGLFFGDSIAVLIQYGRGCKDGEK
jgi:hypothetical protein